MHVTYCRGAAKLFCTFQIRSHTISKISAIECTSQHVWHPFPMLVMGVEAVEEKQRDGWTPYDTTINPPKRYENSWVWMIEHLTDEIPPLDGDWWPGGCDPLVQDDEAYSEEATCDLSPQPALRVHEVTTSERGSQQAGIGSPNASCWAVCSSTFCLQLLGNFPCEQSGVNGSWVCSRERNANEEISPAKHGVSWCLSI